MNIQHFLERHGIAANPFVDEDAQSDLVFKGACIRSMYHPTWDKIYGDPQEPAAAVVFGEKGAGKTALRLQIVRHLTDYNADHPDKQAFVVQYDDFNPFLDRFRERFSGRKRRPDRLLDEWRLWDHMDAILSLGVTQLVDRILENKQARHPAARDGALPIDRLEPSQRRDVLLLAACYDQSTDENALSRFKKLRRKLRFSSWTACLDLVFAIVAGVALVAAYFLLGAKAQGWEKYFGVGIALAWLPRAWRFLKWQWIAFRIRRSTRTLHHPISLLRKMLSRFPTSSMIRQPLPSHARTDDRYELLAKFQSVLQTLGFEGALALVDRVDEPYLVNGSTELMKALIWPMLDNKFLKHPGLGVKMLLPIELERLIDREDRDFHQRARLDKQNMIRSLAWTGQSLYDLANVRLRACAIEGQTPSLSTLFDPSVDQRRLTDAFASLRVPRHLFKFMYRLLTAHCNSHSDEDPAWQIGSGVFESTLALYLRDQDAFDRGVGAG